MEQGRTQRTTGSSAEMSGMKAGLVGEKQTESKKKSGIVCKRQKKIFKSPIKVPTTQLL